MRKVYKLENLDCANCAAKMQDDISKIEGVTKASVSFLMQKLTIQADVDDIDPIIDEAQRVCSKYEPDCVILR